MKYFVFFLISAIPAYVLGSANGAIITSKYLYRKDIREYGSGNPGLTNFYRVFGKGGTLLVITIDVLKTLAPVIFGGWLFWRYLGVPPSDGWLFKRFFEVSLLGEAITGFFIMLGHCFPVFYRFKGGKGVLATGAMLFLFDWRLALISWGMFIIITALTRYVSLGAMIGGALFPISLLLFKIGGIQEFIAMAMCALLLIARHTPNIKRLVKGEETKFSFHRAK